MALSKEQVAFFKEEGYLILEGFIAPAQVAAWRGQFWAHVGSDPQDSASWPDSYVSDGRRFEHNIDEAFDWLESVKKRRFFLFFHGADTPRPQQRAAE